MDRKIVIVGLLLGSCIVSNAVAEPLAPGADIDAKMAKLVKAKDRVVPDTSEVKVPAYPGSKFCSIKKGKYGPTAWNTVLLLSVDSYEKVTAWYREKMGGWYCKEWSTGITSSCSDKDPGAAGNYDPETFNVVKITKSDRAFPCVLSGTKTLISIQFQPD